MMKGFNPKVSIVMPVCNGSNYLREAIDSALAQTYKNIEVIVVNDGSTDGGKTEEIAKSYGDKIRYFHKGNGGVSSALNLGIREMKGEYFSWLSHDDVYYSEKIESQIEHIKKTGKNVILYSDYEFIDHQAKIIKRKCIPRIETNRFRLALIISDPVNGCTVLIHRDCFNQVGLFNEDLLTTQDYDMWFRLAHRYEFAHIPMVLLKSRLHPEQGMKTHDGHQSEVTELIARCLSDLSTDEIRKFTGEPLCLFYVKTALKLKIRSLSDASKYAYGMSRQHLGSESHLAQLYCQAWSIVYRLINRNLSPMYWARRFRQPFYKKSLPVPGKFHD
jgi:glycosyltransferase involved in cell wall biosynthesis